MEPHLVAHFVHAQYTLETLPKEAKEFSNKETTYWEGKQNSPWISVSDSDYQVFYGVLSPRHHGSSYGDVNHMVALENILEPSTEKGEDYKSYFVGQAWKIILEQILSTQRDKIWGV